MVGSGEWELQRGRRKREACVRFESAIGTQPDEDGYESEHEAELEGPEGHKDSLEPWAFGVEFVEHAALRVGVSRDRMLLLLIQRSSADEI